MNKLKLPLFILLLINQNAFGQIDTNTFISWSSTRRLSINDFGIKTKNSQTNSSFGQFTIGFRVNGFDFLTKNFNKKVSNHFIKAASWIDTTTNIGLSIRYEQTLFDLAEIYTRHFRRDLKINRKKIAYGTKFIEKLNNDIMAEFAKRRVLYDTESKFGRDELAQRKWEIIIQNELNSLKELSSE